LSAAEAGWRILAGEYNGFMSLGDSFANRVVLPGPAGALGDIDVGFDSFRRRILVCFSVLAGLYDIFSWLTGKIR
jgi:hypothetical protein